MQLTFIKTNEIYSSALPEKQRGQYWVTQINEDNKEVRVISIEGSEGKWILKSNKNATILDENNQKLKEVIIEPLHFYNVFLNKTNEKTLVYSEPITEDRRIFEKLLLPKQGKLVIGRNKDCEIIFSNAFASLNHAEIIISPGEISINDLNSSNGTFVNGKRVKSRVLIPGDLIYVMGLKIIINKDFIAINNPDGQMEYNKLFLKKFINQTPELSEEEQYEEDEEITKDLFYRSPRFKRDIEKVEFKIDPPPSIGDMQQTPLMLMLGPSITMGMSSLFMAMLTIENVTRTNGDMRTALPTLVMSFSMLLGTILWPVLTKRYEKKTRIKREKIRQAKYKEYINKVCQEIADECVHQIQILHENHVDIYNCANRIKNRERNLWERTRQQNDFLKIRLGIGDLPIEADIRYPEKRFTLDDDNLTEELYKLAEEPKVLKQVPVTLSLVEKSIIGIIGSRNNVKELIKGLIIQLVALHSYDELKLVFIYDENEQESWEFVKWMPHVWNNDKSIRFVATNSSEVKELSAFLEKEIMNRESIASEDELEDLHPYYVIFSMSKDLASKAEMINSILKHKKNYGFSLVALYGELKNLPKECSTVVELDAGKSRIYDKNDITGKQTAFKQEDVIKLNINGLAISLANIQLDSSAGVYELPNMLTFLEMFGVGKVEHLNALARWKANDPTITLEAPIGVDTTGELFKLDLHEKFHGPHGLIAGMTGSGKSEFIMTFILSLALNYHPHEVAFILIDYKGGGMANTFANLPHLAGTITNLDGAAVKRSLVSIQSELKRRQAIFNEASKIVNVSNIDIYKYQKLYRDGSVTEPLQHLFIISDEFAELKTQQPEFMEQLVSAARIGRSLGVHLILATQKPAGVVDDQIWSNSKFRICLKVQEKADSMDVIKRPDAAELSVTGRYYVQVGFNEVFELGQSAWGGAPYYPVDKIEKKIDESIAVIDNLGRVIKQVKVDKRRTIDRNPPKQIDEIVKYINVLAKEENIKVRQLWLEPIAPMIYIDELKEKHSVDVAKCILNPIIGEVDDPANQRQIVMTLPITQEGNTVVYGSAGSGKTTFLTTLIYSLMDSHTPAELNLYILDFGSETLRAFSKAPHVGDVLLSHEVEKINNLFKILYGVIDKRKKMFSDYGGDYQSYIKATKENLETIVVMIHNYSAFAEIYEEKEDAITYLTREGIKYGIYFVVTALNTGAIRYRILQNFKQLYVLQLNDQNDYSGVLGNVDGVYPSKYKGRGIFKSSNVYEFQTAHISQKAENTFEFVRNYCNEYAEKWKHAGARKVPILPKRVDLEYLTDEIKNCEENKIPIGVEKSSLNISYYDFDRSYINLVLSQNNDKVDFVQGLSEVMSAKAMFEVIVLDPESMYNADENKMYKYYDGDANLDEAIIKIFNTLITRNSAVKDEKEQGIKKTKFNKIICIINSLSGLMLRISEDSKDKLKAFMEEVQATSNVNIIITDKASNISSVVYESWFKAKVSLSDGIWIGNGITDQYHLKVTKITNDLYKEIEENFGYTLNKGKVKLIKVLSTATNNMEEEING